ncbi:MAG: hypothetical protein IGS23_03785 [Rivularia sp. T60_A2020_040]|nr:hypothetical protein [Rivularia sp. T60_A2020_040]
MIYFCLCFSNLLLLAPNETGIKALSRLLGLSILAVGVKLILNGFAEWVAKIQLMIEFTPIIANFVQK